MSTLTISLNDIPDGNIRYLPKHAAGNFRDIPCRGVGPEGNRRFLLFATEQEIRGGKMAGDDFSRTSRKPYLLPKDLEEELKIPEDAGHTLFLVARAAFPEHITVFRVYFPEQSKRKCSLCKKKNEKEEASEATGLAFTNIWGSVVVSETCDHHYKKNHLILTDDLCV